MKYGKFVFLFFFLQESYERAKAILKKHEVEHKRLAKALMCYETLTKEEITDVVNNKPLKRNNGDALKRNNGEQCNVS